MTPDRRLPGRYLPTNGGTSLVTAPLATAPLATAPPATARSVTAPSTMDVESPPDVARKARLPAIRSRAAPRIRGRALGDRCIRPLNLIVAAILIVLAAPAMVLIAFAVKVTSRGPVLYRQWRVGHDRRRRRRATAVGESERENERRAADAGGRVFTMYKFRTMYHREANSSGEVRASPDDPRITPIGSMLRQHRLDEIPQLFNVLRGDMNVVGPRPEQPGLFQELGARVPDYHRRQAVLPGITGWAQVNHGYDQSIDDVRRKVELDLEYIRRRSPAEDLGIMARTLPVMISRRGSL